MKTLRFLLLLLILGLFSPSLFGQGQSNLRKATLSSDGDTILLDSLSLVPGSFSLFVDGQLVDTADYHVNEASSMLVWKTGKRPKGKEITSEYRVFPMKLDKPYFHKDPDLIGPDQQGERNPFIYTSKPTNDDVFNLGGLDKRGSISRGVNFGNNQDLSVNSNLNLQLAGKLNEKVSILAAISDDNIPIQPDGNTQQLQEFDRVFIQLYDQQSKLIAGDFQLTSRPSYFMKYNKRSQGGSFSTSFPVDKADTAKGTNRVQASAAVSRGKFARNVIQGVEGNQGPYRLRGAEDELFIVVLSGTERVFMDGRQLTRGQENDYVIDYNTSEVTFTAKRLITKDKRIVIEFQYSDKNYARSLFQFSNDFSSKRLNLNFRFYSEQDSRNQPLQQELDENKRNILRNAGDSLNRAIASGIDSLPFSDDLVLYRLADTIVFTEEPLGDTTIQVSTFYDSIYIHSIDPESANYQLTFSRVGQGNGDYVLDQSLANGRVFRWVPPVQGVKQGDYAPLIQLISPKQRQMLMVGGAYQISEQTALKFEGAFSNNDLNTFSSVDADDDLGFAFKAGIDNKKPLGKGSQDQNWELISGLNLEHLSKDFTSIERIRNVEFDRDWNLRDVVLEASQTIGSLNLGLQKRQVGTVVYTLNTYNSGGQYNALRNKLSSRIKRPGYAVQYDGSWLTSGGTLDNSNFLRHKTLASKNWKAFQFGYRDDLEINRFQDANSDSLRGNSYSFWEWEVFVANADTTANRYKVSYTQRTDQALAENRLKPATFGESFGFSFDLIKNPKNQLRGRISYRTLQIRDSSITQAEPDNTFLNRLEYTLRLFKGAITSNSFYEVGSGLESRKEFTFIPVESGLGAYTWNDYNDDGLQQLDEFEISAFQDTANYIKVFTPTDIYIKVFSNQFNQSFFVRPAAVWAGKTGVRKLVSRFSDQIAFSIDRKTEDESDVSRFNPFLQNVLDDNLINLNANLRNTLYFNRSNPIYGFDLNYQNISNKTALTGGFDSRGNVLTGLRGRWNFTRMFSLNGEYTNGTRSNQSDVFASRNYSIDYMEAKPTLSYQPNSSFRLSLFFEYTDKVNALDSTSENPTGGETALLQTLGADVKYNSVGKGSLLANFNFIQIDYSGANNNAVAFEMLEGLQPGQNGTWSLSYQRTLAGNLQLSLNYNGRSSKGVPVVHSGGVQVRAFF